MNMLFGKKENICDEFTEKLDRFRHGELPEDEFLRLEAHRSVCARCRRALEEEERIESLMAELPEVEVSPDFRDRVLRAWRVKRDTVKEALPERTIRSLQVALAIVAAVLLLLPMARTSLYIAANRLTGAFDRIPPEYREGLEISFTLPTWAEISAQMQVWQGRLFESMGDIGATIAPWSGWLWGLFIVALLLAAWNVWWFRMRLPVSEKERN